MNWSNTKKKIFSPCKHVAIIMDGNGRWAKARGLPRLAGHKKGVEVVDEIVTAAMDLNLSHLTLYAFSSENWQRPAEEVQGLMQLLEAYLELKKEKMLRDGVRFETIGVTSLLPETVQKKIAEVKEMTSRNEKLTLILALSYGARQEIVQAAKKLAKAKIEDWTEENFSRALDTGHFPDPDLFIRTSGEHRISNYLLWQMAYTELYFTEVLWPDFTAEELNKAVCEYESRERRFGKTSEQL